MSGSGGESKTYDNKEKIDEILRELALESKIRVIENTPKYKNTITNVNSFLEQDKDYEKKNLCIVTFGRFQPPHKGHIELLDINSKVSEYIKLKYSRKYDCKSYIWLSSNLLESGMVSTSASKEDISELMSNLNLDDKERAKRAAQRQKRAETSALQTKEPLDLNEKLRFILKMTDYDKNLHYLVDQNVSEKNRTTMDEKQIKFNKTTIGANTPSGQTLRLLERLFRNNMKEGLDVKIIFILGSDRVNAFREYNTQPAEKLFGKGNFTVIQAGNKRGSAGEGKETDDIKKNQLVGRSVAGEYSGTTLRKAITDLTLQGEIPNTLENRKRMEYILYSIQLGDMKIHDYLELINLVRLKNGKKEFTLEILNTFLQKNVTNPKDILRGGKRKTRKRKKKKKKKMFKKTFKKK